MNIKYIGDKPLKRDNVAETGLTWTPGQVQDVDPIAAAKLLCHTMVWQKAEEPESKGKTPPRQQ